MYSLNLPKLLTTNAEPRTKYAYINQERSDTVEGYVYRLIDIVNGEVLNITLSQYKKIPSQSYIEVLNAVGTPYISGNRAVMSIKADDIVLVDD